jgi:hypothetical protein
MTSMVDLESFIPNPISRIRNKSGLKSSSGSDPENKQTKEKLAIIFLCHPEQDSQAFFQFFPVKVRSKVFGFGSRSVMIPQHAVPKHKILKNCLI